MLGEAKSEYSLDGFKLQVERRSCVAQMSRGRARAWTQDRECHAVIGFVRETFDQPRLNCQESMVAACVIYYSLQFELTEHST